jgi:hypothetical protein
MKLGFLEDRTPPDQKTWLLIHGGCTSGIKQIRVMNKTDLTADTKYQLDLAVQQRGLRSMLPGKSTDYGTLSFV